MRSLKLFFPLALAGGLASGCTSLSDPTTAFSAIVATYSGAVAAEVAYESLPSPNVGTVRELETFRIAADAVLHPIELAIAAGSPPSSDTVLAAQTAVGALTQYELANNVGTGG